MLRRTLTHFFIALWAFPALASSIQEVKGKYSSNYVTEVVLTPENARTRVAKNQETSQPFFFGENQFEILVKSEAFPVRVPPGKKEVILRMPSNQDPGCRALGEAIEKMLKSKTGQIKAQITLSPYVKKISEKPLELRLTQVNVFFWKKDGKCAF